MRVYHAEAAAQPQDSTCPSKPEARESGTQSYYYHCDEKSLTATGNLLVTVKWVKRPHLVGETALVARSKFCARRFVNRRCTLVLRASDLSSALRAAGLQRNPNAGQILLDFRYEDRLFWSLLFVLPGKICQSLLSLLPALNAAASCLRTPFVDERCNVSTSAVTRWKVSSGR
jgi:hypothetical protein